MELIVGLGNPGRGYEKNRHNIGFICLNHLAKAHDITFDKKQCHARVGMGYISGKEVVLARLQTYMNASGESVFPLIQRYKASPDNLLVIHDDMDLPTGKLRIRRDSSSGGHKGINSIIACLGTRDFVRFRIGIGRPEEPLQNIFEKNVISHVLGDFSNEEKKIIEETIPRVTAAIECYLSEGLETAMNKFNG
jgi:peptidyl-tRNA hydrolase, PTH1 family